ncbi:MAG: LpxD N-terminal domain-containing protein, partial [Kiritimatiellia bacterium]
MAATLTLGALAEHLGATLEGDPAAVVTGVADLQSARAGQVSFAGNPKYMSAVATSGATAVIVPQDAAIASPRP